MKEVKLPSGAVLRVNVAPFAASKALYQAVLREMRSISLKSANDIGEVIKDFFCLGFSSTSVEMCLDECMKRCTYNNGKGDLKIDKDTFEEVSTRQDYIQVCLEVAKENISPFAKSLYAEFLLISATIDTFRA